MFKTVKVSLVCYLVLCGFDYPVQETIVVVGSTACTVSLMCSRNRRGASTVPCGTPDLTSSSLERAPSTTTPWFHPTSKYVSSYTIELKLVQQTLVGYGVEHF